MHYADSLQTFYAISCHSVHNAINESHNKPLCFENNFTLRTFYGYYGFIKKNLGDSGRVTIYIKFTQQIYSDSIILMPVINVPLPL